MAAVGLRRVAVWGFAAPIVALVVVAIAEGSVGWSWTEPLVALTAFALTTALSCRDNGDGAVMYGSFL